LSSTIFKLGLLLMIKNNLNGITMTDFNLIAQEIASQEGCTMLGLVGSADERYPLYQIQRGRGKKVLISAGVHGDEPAGVHAILRFLKEEIQKYEDRFAFTIFPCVNPYGFVKSTKRNAQDLNINRQFKTGSAAEEVNLIMAQLEKDGYEFTMDLHETGPDSFMDPDEPSEEHPSEFYLWETCEDKELRVGHEIVKNIEKMGLPVCKWPTIYDDINNGGVIWYPENCGTAIYAAGTTFEAYLHTHHTKQAFTIETPSGWKLKDRILAHIVSLRKVLEKK